MRINRYLLSVPLVVGLMGAAGCTGDKSSPDGVAGAGGAGAKGPSPGPSRSLDPRDAQLEFARCMRRNGIDMADPGAATGPGGTGAVRIGKGGDTHKLEAAMNACRPYLQAGGKLADPKDPKVRDRQLKFAQCMRQHGIDMPDPKPDGGITIRMGKAGSDRVEKAMRACRQFTPGMGAK